MSKNKMYEINIPEKKKIKVKTPKIRRRVKTGYASEFSYYSKAEKKEKEKLKKELREITYHD